jgi:hypothetical protein
MSSVPRKLVRATSGILAILALGAVVVAVSLTSHGPSASAAALRAPTPPATVTASLITRLAGTLKPGTVVGSGHLGERVFPNAQHGFALADVGQGQYPAATINGGKTWMVAGPVLHVNAAQAPLVVQQVGASSQHTFFAWGGPGGGQAVDVTRDAGKHWYRAILGDIVMAVVSGPGGELVAFAQVAADNSGTTAATWVYVSKDGGRHWHYNTSVGAL